jgi:rhodanese-related sulfurtransferase
MKVINEINAKELKALLDSKEDIKFIDCRELPEWKEAHIEGATLLPLSVFEHKYEEILKDKNEAIYIQCRSGKRSLNACMFLMSKGFTNLYNVEGGIISWIQEGFATKSE